jgi:hypothetical protein
MAVLAKSGGQPHWHRLDHLRRRDGPDEEATSPLSEVAPDSSLLTFPCTRRMARSRCSRADLLRTADMD